jgi:hypothetical protein
MEKTADARTSQVPQSGDPVQYSNTPVLDEIMDVGVPNTPVLD